MTETNTYDYGIIGSGPAGLTAAIIAAKQGFSVILFEKDELGGVCLNKGAIPTKTILNTVETYSKIKNSQDIGIEVNDIKLNLPKLIERENEVIKTIKSRFEKEIDEHNITFIQKEAKLIDEHTIECYGNTYKFSKIIAATGSTPKSFRGIDFDHKFILNSEDLLNINEIPQKVLIIGAGAEGIEWARIFNAMGTEVTIAEKTSRLLHSADIEISRELEKIFKEQGIKTYLSTDLESIKDKKAKLTNGEILNPDFVLITIGRHVTRFSNDNNNITYLGDAYGSLMLATFAMYQARALVSDIVFDNVFVPSVVYGTPEIAWIGANEQDLPNGSYQKVVYPLSLLAKANCDRETIGFVKVLTYKDYIIGAHIIGKEASALIHEFAIAMQNNIKISELKKVCFAHPTYSEAVYESILNLQ
ncbi:NAD(P)/FAD-dependent oxidoreductase [bacterium]|nr:NAD(P)/FAD-dependent oxidoreductase [bacterium]